MCPCIERTLIRAVTEPIHGLDDEHAIHSLVEQTLEAIITHGDLLEMQSTTQEDTDGVLLYASPPSFVCRQSGAVLILGIAPDGVSPLPEDLETAVEHVNHIRVIPEQAVPELAAQLGDLGLVEITLDAWMKAPERETPFEHLQSMKQRLASAQPCSEIPGLMLLDPSRPVNYYRGRWVELAGQDGCFLARRPQSYGADLWCFIEVEAGNPLRFVDLPVREIGTRGCDDGWRLQAAIDHERGFPQTFRIRGTTDACILDFFSPVPMWSRRRWDAFGEPVVAKGCLFSYRVAMVELDEELEFIKEHLWLAQDS